MHINDLLKIAIEMDASDVHLKAGNHPQFRVHGLLVPMTQLPKLGPADTEQIAAQIMTETQRRRMEEEHDLDLAYSLPGFGRFRGSIYRQRGTLAVALRIIPFEVRSFEELLLPPVTEKIASAERGLVLVTGSTSCHIITTRIPSSTCTGTRKASSASAKWAATSRPSPAA